MPQAYPANPKAVQFVTQLTLIMGICQRWINFMMMTEGLPADMRPFYQDIAMLIGLAESCTFTADSIEFLDATGTRCKVEFDLARPYTARLFRWDDNRRGHLETTERWIQDDDGRVMTPERAIQVVNQMVDTYDGPPRTVADYNYQHALLDIIAKASSLPTIDESIPGPI
ncbi:MAG: hypothetical protein U0X20_11735 [Caldilineaceae bacterium]